MENVELVNTSEKYAPMAETIVPVLFQLLRDRVALDEDIWAKDEEIGKQNIANGLREHAPTPEKKALWEEYHKRFFELIEGRVSEKLLKKSGANCMKNRSDYFYINGEFQAEFTMRQYNMATIIISFKTYHIEKHKFVMRLIDDKWLLDSVYHVWHTGSWGTVGF